MQNGARDTAAPIPFVIPHNFQNTSLHGLDYARIKPKSRFSGLFLPPIFYENKGRKRIRTKKKNKKQKMQRKRTVGKHRVHSSRGIGLGVGGKSGVSRATRDDGGFLATETASRPVPGPTHPSATRRAPDRTRRHAWYATCSGEKFFDTE